MDFAPVNNRTPHQPTLAEVSEVAGVSAMTASRVLNNKEDVSEATRQRVLEAAKAVGYMPNRIAGSLASQRVNLVAVIVPSISNMVFPEVMTGITEVLDKTGLQPVVGITGYKPGKEEKVLYEMLSWRPSGVIIAGLDHTESCNDMLRSSNMPIVEIMDVDGAAVDSVVGISHRRAGRQMAKAILKAGFEHIAFLGTQLAQDIRARKRFEGFTEVMAKAGIEIEDREFYSGGSTLVKGREMTKKVMERSPELDFIYYSNDLIGAGGLLYILSKGLKIPSQMGMAGFNKLKMLDGLPLELASMDSCRHEIGRKAAEIIVRRVEAGSEGVSERIVLDPKISYGSTLRRR